LQRFESFARFSKISPEVLTMHKSSSNFSMLCFRSRVLVCLMLVIFSFSFIPSVSLAQQPTATINTLSGTVLVNGQEQGKGTVLTAGDVIETQAGASVVLEFSDGSQLELGENTKVDLAQLSESGTGARVSRLKLAWGWIRAKLSPGHQKEGSTFDVETPNALVGVKFSQPIVEISVYNGVTEVIATVMVVITHLITGEIMQLSPGSTAIITEKGIEIVSGTAAGMSTTAKFGIGALALGAAGGVVAIVSSSGGDGSSGDSNVSFAGDFRYQADEWTKILNLRQNGNSITGTYSFTYSDPEFPSCREAHVGQVNGTAHGNSATLNFTGTSTWSCEDGYSESPVQESFTESCTLGDNNILTCEGYEYTLLN
jgi:hypothetical protein